MTKPFLDIKTRLEKRVRIEGECWIWLGSKSRQGYGYIGIRVGLKNTKVMKAHRVSYEAFTGPIPADTCVLHKCDTPSCINPEHLFLGSNLDNVADKVSKGRCFGKLDARSVREIRDRYVPGNGRSLAREFNVSPMTVSLLVNGKTHTHRAIREVAQ